MVNKKISIYVEETASPIGSLVLAATDRGLCFIEFGTISKGKEKLEQWAKRWFGDYELLEETGALQPVKQQLEQYFNGTRQHFEFELDLYGTDFQKRVWKALESIPYGTTASYKDMAQAIGSPKAVRAVGGANNRNPIPVVIPCHRVIGASGELVGYGGGLPIKLHLLQLEGQLECKI